MKKVLFIMPAMLGGGAEKVLIDILKNMNQDMYDLSLLLEYREGLYTPSVPDNVKIYSLYNRNSIWIERLHRVLKLLRLYHVFHSIVYKMAFRRLLRTQTFDTIVSFMEGEAVRIHSYLHHSAVKNVSWVHIDFLKKHWSLDFFKNCAHEMDCYSLMDKVVFVSDDARQSFRKLYPITEGKTQVLYNLIDKSEIVRLADTLDICKRKLTICMVGRLNKQKRYDRALDAVKKLKDEGLDFELWILGVGELEDELLRYCEELQISDSCRFWGFVRPPYPYMNKADIYLNTSEAEGYPLVLCEALCLGLPVVATDITGANELLDASRYGLLVEESVDGIADGIRAMLTNVTLREEFRKKAMERSKMFSVDKVMNEIDAVLC